MNGNRTPLLVAVFLATGLSTGPGFAIEAAKGGPSDVSVTVGPVGAGAPNLAISTGQLVGLEVVTKDGKAVGKVDKVDKADNGDEVLIISVAKDAIPQVSKIAVRLSSVTVQHALKHNKDNPKDGFYSIVTTTWQVVIGTDSADLLSSIQSA